jgi:hypothetical protein
MQDTSTHEAGELEEIGGEEGAAQQLEQILASGPPPLYRRAYRILGNTADAEDAVQVRQPQPVSAAERLADHRLIPKINPSSLN